MKKIIISTIMVVLVAGFATAYPHRGYYNNQGYGGEQFAEIKELTGELVINTNSFPSIKVSGGDVTVITLGADVVESLKLKKGSKITVRGYSMNTSDGAIFEVTQLDSGNKTYEVHGYGYGGGDGYSGGGYGYGGYGRHGGGGYGRHRY